MKNISNITVILAGCLVLQGCVEEPRGQQPQDSVPPGPVTNVTVQNIAGGAVFRYDLPDDEDLLYVKAVYDLKGGEAESKASIYADSLAIFGFGNTDEREVRLITVDRSRNESAAEVVTVQPLEPDVSTIGNTLDLKADFGGVTATWKNPNSAEVSVNVLVKDEFEDYVPLETFYSSRKEGKAAVRGMDTLTVDVMTYVQDKWDNESERKYYTLLPLYETEFDKSKFATLRLDGDMGNVQGYEIPKIWDKNTSSDPCYSSPGSTGIWPQWITFDLGQVGKISRVVVYQRVGSAAYIWGEGNLRKFQIWGSKELDYDVNSGNWKLLMDCESIKPSGLPMGENTDEDLAVARNGEEFINSPENPPVRYIRIKVTQTWAGGDNFQIQELDFYGDNRY